uniref:TNFR-Cys domain-containing protein n=1 Tax=Labrus bergylta TaxID=56723 RepID=A0A3Q3FMR5_9LABR
LEPRSTFKGAPPTSINPHYVQLSTVFLFLLFSLRRIILLHLKKNVLLLFQTGGRVYADCTELRNTLCKLCPEGTFMDHRTSRTRCYDCKSCDEGSGLKMKTSCTIESDTVCEPLEGFYCSDSRKDDCVELNTFHFITHRQFEFNTSSPSTFSSSSWRILRRSQD